MRKEAYFWILFAVIVISAAGYARYYYRPALAVSVKFTNDSYSAYPYQNVPIPIIVGNGGSALIRNLNIGVFVNDNLTDVYNVTLPVGKNVTLYFNYTPKLSGRLSITAIADPGNLYNIKDRRGAEGGTLLFVNDYQAPAPYSLLPNTRPDSLEVADMNSGGYLFSSYLSSNYNITEFSLSNINAVNNFLYPIMNLTYNYIAELSFASARYNGSKIYSFWIRGYLSPAIIRVAATGRNLNTTDYRVGPINVTFVELGYNSTLCSWYSGGWIKSIGYSGSGTCLRFVNASMGSGFAYRNYSVGANGGSILANYTIASSNGLRYGSLVLYQNGTFVYAGIWRNNSKGGCFGVISYLNNVSYCNEVLLQRSGKIGNFSLLRTMAVINNDNVSVLSLVNNSRLFDQVAQNEYIENSLNITGTSSQFVSVLRNSCSFPGSLGCFNISYGISNVTFQIANRMNASIRLNSIGCYWHGGSRPSLLNRTLLKNQTASLTVPCYDRGFAISGVPLNLNLNLFLNYSLNNTSHTLQGKAFIV